MFTINTHSALFLEQSGSFDSHLSFLALTLEETRKNALN